MNRQFINENGHLEIIRADAKSIDKELVFPGSYRYMEDVTILRDINSKVTSVQRTKDVDNQTCPPGFTMIVGFGSLVI